MKVTLPVALNFKSTLTPSSLSSATTVSPSDGGCWALILSTSAWFSELWSIDRGKALHDPSSSCTPRTTRQSPAFATWIPSVPTWATQAVQPAKATWKDNVIYVSTTCDIKYAEIRVDSFYYLDCCAFHQVVGKRQLSL